MLCVGQECAGDRGFRGGRGDEAGEGGGDAWRQERPRLLGHIAHAPRERPLPRPAGAVSRCLF